MSKEPDDPIFLDTSIQIARKIHRPEIQHSISVRLRRHGEIVSGLVVRQEFKRRLLKEALYLLKQLEARKSYQKVLRHISDSLPRAQQRKMKINLQLLQTVDESDGDDDRYDRSRLMLRDLIRNGIATAEAQLTRLNKATGCACAQQPIVEKKPFSNYEFGTDRCSKTNGRCGIGRFLEANRSLLAHIHDYLDVLPPPGQDGGRTEELERARLFIRRFMQDPTGIEAEEPCLSVGDLLIAMESLGCATLYTMNLRESQHLARALDQSMIYRPPNSDKLEIECLASEETWPSI